MKKYTKCKQEKEFTRFYKNKPSCKECEKHEKAEWYKNNRATAIKRSSAYNKLHPEKGKQRVNKWRYINQYGITIEQYDQMLVAQEHRCAICNRHQSEFKAKLCVDHCHSTGKVRALLCNPCNRGFGAFDEQADRLVAACAYANKHKAN